MTKAPRHGSGGLRRAKLDLIARAQEETATTIVRILFTFVGASSFCLLALLGPDSSLLTGQTITVPFAGTVSFLGFMIVGPALLIMLRIYLQIYIEHGDRLSLIGSHLKIERAPTLIARKNIPLRIFIFFGMHLLLPLTAAAFAWKAAAMPMWVPAMSGLCGLVIAGQLSMLPNWTWARRTYLSGCVAAVLATIAAIPLLIGTPPLRRPFNLQSADLAKRWLLGADLKGANLKYANLQGANLIFVDLSDAKLYMANLAGANLSGANLQGADLGETDLTGADFLGADLSRANLGMAHIKGAHLDAKLAASTFEFTDFSDVDLSNLDLSNTKISQKQIDQARGDDRTKLPPGVTRPLTWATTR